MEVVPKLREPFKLIKELLDVPSNLFIWLFQILALFGFPEIRAAILDCVGSQHFS